MLIVCVDMKVKQLLNSAKVPTNFFHFDVDEIFLIIEKIYYIDDI